MNYFGDMSIHTPSLKESKQTDQPSTFPIFHGLFRFPSHSHKRTPSIEIVLAYDSGTVFFMIVSLPADAADTICCSIDLVTLALSA